MASHRRPRAPLPLSPARRRGIGITTVALASVTLFSQLSQSPAHASPGDGGPSDRPSVEEVGKRVDALYREAGSATQRYNAAKERTDRQRKKVDGLLDRIAERADKLNDARRTLGSYAAAQYRAGAVSETAVLLLSPDPQSFFGHKHLMGRLTDHQLRAVEDYRREQREAGRERAEAGAELAELTASQRRLAADKKTVQDKLAQARKLLAKLTAEEKARLEKREREREEEARRKAAAAAAERERQRAEAERRQREEAGSPDAGTGTDTGTATGTGADTGTDGAAVDGSYAAKAEKVVAFAEAQLGKPYVWGAGGPNSYDCSGLTRAAWREAGVSLPRTTYDQAEVGTRVAKSRLHPGDLVFFYDDISHVGIYVGGGQMIHAPKPGARVRYESIDHMPFHGAVRPA